MDEVISEQAGGDVGGDTDATDQCDVDRIDADDLVDELLIEEISIDGMCGVY